MAESTEHRAEMAWIPKKTAKKTVSYTPIPVKHVEKGKPGQPVKA